MNKEFTQKDADELLSIEAMCIQLMNKAKALRIKFAPEENEVKKKPLTKKQLFQQHLEANWAKVLEKRMKQHLQNKK
jgi:hypothetical protein